MIEAKEGQKLYGEACDAREKTMSYSIMRNHSKTNFKDKMNIKFDALISHDITYVGIIQTARASGLTEFPVPYGRSLVGYPF